MTSQMVSCSGPVMCMFYVIMAATVRGRHHATMTTDSRHLSEGIRICFSCPIGKSGFISAQRCPICLKLCVIILAKLLGKPSDPTVFSIYCEIKICIVGCLECESLLLVFELVSIFQCPIPGRIALSFFKFCFLNLLVILANNSPMKIR